MYRESNAPPTQLKRLPLLRIFVLLFIALPPSLEAQQPVWANEHLPKQPPARNAVPAKARPPRITDNGHDSPYQEALRRRARIHDDQTYQDTGDPVSPTLGLVTHSSVDLFIPGRGIDFSLERTYNSHKSDIDGKLGYGWDFSYNARLTTTLGGTAIALHDGSNSEQFYKPILGSSEFTSDSGIYTLFKLEAPATYILRNREGVKTFFQGARLDKIQDAAGNKLSFFYADGLLDYVVDTMGRVIDFHFNEDARLDWVEDFRGRRVEYYYDANGDLTGVRTPTVTSTGGFNDFPSGRIERYTYLSGFGSLLDHKLASIVRPNDVTQTTPPYGTPAVQFTYDTTATSAFFGWCKSQVLGGTNSAGAAGGTINYSYATLDVTTSLSAPNALKVGRLKSTVTDRKGFVTDYVANQNGNVIAVVEHTSGSTYTTTNEYNAEGELVQIIQPRGNQSNIAYDSGLRLTQGNITQILDTTAGIPSDQASHLTLLEYEPIFNNLRRSTDPRGVVTEYVTDYEEGIDSEGNEEDIVALVEAELLGLYPRGYVTSLIGGHLSGFDWNGDDIKNQVHGKVVAVRTPPATLNPLGAAPLISLYATQQQESFYTSTFNEYGQLTSETDDELNTTIYLYYPELDPDGDGVATLPGAGLNPLTGGYLRRKVEDTLLPYADPQLDGIQKRSVDAIGRDSGQDPSPILATTDYFYNPSGSMTALVDPRGVRSEFLTNELDEIWKTVRASDVSAASGRHGGVDETDETLSGQAFSFVTLWKRDANGNLLAHFVENYGGTADAVAVAGAPVGYFESYWTYDILNTPRTETREYGFSGEVATWTFGYDANGNRDSIVFPEGNGQLYTWDFRDHLKSMTRGAGLEASQVTFSRDANSNLVQTIDGRGLSTIIEFDGFDRASQVTKPADTEERLTYDSQDNVTVRSLWGHIAGPSSNIVELQRTSYAYDERGRLTQVDSEDPQATLVDGSLSPSDGRVTTAYGYDRLDRRVLTFDDDGSHSEQQFDGASRVEQIVDPVGNVVVVRCDDEGNIVKAIEKDIYPNGAFRTFETYDVFDSLGRRLSSTDNIGRTERFDYDSRDYVVQHSDALASLSSEFINGRQTNHSGNTTTLRVDGLGRIVLEQSDLRVGGTGDGVLDTPMYNLDGKITRIYSYDKNSRIRYATDDRGKQTQFQYDTLDRLKTTIYADGTQFVQNYDGNDNVVTATDAVGNFVLRTYDAQNRLTAVDATPRAPAVGSSHLRYEYDGLERLTKSIDSVDSVLGNGDDWVNEYTWDSLGHKKTSRQNGRLVTTTWREENKKSSIGYPSGVTVQYAYDALERVTAVTQGSQLASYVYAGKNRLLQREDLAGVRQRFYSGLWNDTLYYDGAKRPIKVDFKKGSTLLTGLEFGFDQANNRLFVRRLHNGSKGDNYVYDSKYRLFQIERDVDASQVGIPGGSLLDSRMNYELDGVHNRRRVTSSQVMTFGTSTKTTDYTIDDVNNYVLKQPAPGNPLTQTFDANGNKQSFTQAGTHSLYSYDFLNRLRIIERGSGKIEFDYDAEGKRVRTRVTNMAGYPAVTEFVHDGQHVIEEVDGMSGTPLRRFYYGDDLDELVGFENLAFYPGAGSYFYEQDFHGDVVAIHDGNGAVVERYAYGAFGTPQFQTAGSAKKSGSASDFGNPYLFGGLRYERYCDDLYYVRARFLDCLDGTFMQRDPLGVWSDNVNCGNGKSYVAGNPTSLRDPLGLQSDGIEAALDFLSEHPGAASLAAIASIPIAIEATTVAVGEAIVDGALAAGSAVVEGIGEAASAIGALFSGSTAATAATGVAALGAEGLALAADNRGRLEQGGRPESKLEARARQMRETEKEIDDLKKQLAKTKKGGGHRRQIREKIKQLLESLRTHKKTQEGQEKARGPKGK